MTDQTQDAIVLKDVVASYRRRPVLQGASWCVPNGVTALLGPNGAGKSTLMRCIVGLHRVRGGSIEILGESVGELSAGDAARRVGFAPQNAPLPGLARVEDVVAYAGWLAGMRRVEARAAVHPVLRSLAIDDLADRRVHSLSGGQRQRVVLAAALVNDPAVLILDEPSAGLDPASRILMREAVQSVSTSRAVLISTHLVEDVEHVADHVGVLVEGKIIFSGPASQLGQVDLDDEVGRRPGSDFERGYLTLLGRATTGGLT